MRHEGFFQRSEATASWDPRAGRRPHKKIPPPKALSNTRSENCRGFFAIFPPQNDLIQLLVLLSLPLKLGFSRVFINSPLKLPFLRWFQRFHPKPTGSGRRCFTPSRRCHCEPWDRFGLALRGLGKRMGEEMHRPRPPKVCFMKVFRYIKPTKRIQKAFLWGSWEVPFFCFLSATMFFFSMF